MKQRGDAPAGVVWTGTLAQLKDLFRSAQLIVSVNTFPMHLAVALDRPLVAIVGATHPSVILPAGAKCCYSEYAKDIPYEDVKQLVDSIVK